MIVITLEPDEVTVCERLQKLDSVLFEGLGNRVIFGAQLVD